MVSRGRVFLGLRKWCSKSSERGLNKGDKCRLLRYKGGFALCSTIHTNKVPLNYKKTLCFILSAKLWGLSERSVRNYCTQSRVEVAFLTGKTWNRW